VEEQMATSTESISMENWEDELEETLAGTELRRGELREGTILDIRNDGFGGDIGTKRDGFVPKEDLEDLQGQTFEVGQAVGVVVTRFRDSDGNVELSLSQAMLREDWVKAEKLKEDENVYEATVLAANRGGLTVEFGHLRGFIPMSQLIGFSRIRQANERQRRLNAMVGQSIMLKVIEVNRRRRRLILSQQAAAREWRAARRKLLLEDLETGQVRRGRISQITEFGLFINLGGLDGLVHISELSWGRIEDPREVYHEGQRVKIKVLSVDRERQRIALSIKALAPDPWGTAPERYQEGQLVEGKVSQVVDFGVFVELEPGVEGLLHNTELRDFEQREELTAGQKVLVKVIRVEPDRRRIGLSVRQVRRQEWEEWVMNQPEPGTAEAATPVAAGEDDMDDDDGLDVVDFENEGALIEPEAGNAVDVEADADFENEGALIEPEAGDVVDVEADADSEVAA